MTSAGGSLGGVSVMSRPAGHLAAAFVATALLLAGCGRAQGVADTRQALERAGYRDVAVSLRTGGGIGVARIDAAAAGAPPAEEAARVAWTTLPVRFDQLVVALGGQTASFGYQDLAGRFGPRTTSLDARQVDEEVVESGLKLMLLLSVGAMLSVGAVVTIGLVALRQVRRARSREDQPGPASGLGDDSPTAGVPGASEGPAIPS